MSYYPIRLQAAVFLSAIDFSSKFKIAAIVREKAGPRLQADPLLLPLPPDSPPAFPHIVIRDEGNGWGFQMAPGRFDLIIERGPHMPRVELNQLADEIGQTLLAVWQGLAAQLKAQANRLGLVVTTVTEVEQPQELLRQTYLNPSYGQSALESNLGILHKLEVDGLGLFHWVRLRALPANELVPARLVTEIDINTTGEKPFEVNEAAIQIFLDVARRLIVQALSDYRIA